MNISLINRNISISVLLIETFNITVIPVGVHLLRGDEDTAVLQSEQCEISANTHLKDKKYIYYIEMVLMIMHETREVCKQLNSYQ